MKINIFYISLVLGIITPNSQAGFRHPIEQNTTAANEIQKTKVVHTTKTSSTVVYPKRQVASAQTATKPGIFSSFLQKVKELTSGKAEQKLAQPQNQADNSTAPIKISDLPSAPNVDIPQVLIPSREITIIQDAKSDLKLKGKNRTQILNFAREAREMKLPNREYTTEVRANEIVNKYASSLQKVPFRSIRTALALKLENTSKIKFPPSAISYENMVKRLDALFGGLDLNYAPSVSALWELSQSKRNPKYFQARDALFAGIIAEDAGWEITSRYLLEESVQKRIDKNERYFKILWNQLERFENLQAIDNVVANVNIKNWKDLAPVGDKANYSLARKLQNKKNPALEVDRVQQRISSLALRDRISLLNHISGLTDEKRKDQSIANLRNLAVAGHESVREESRLALARALMQKGSTLEALEFYKSIARTGKNRFEVLSEQVFAEFRAGLHQESLGKSLGLQSPYFQYGFSPDIYIVEVLNRKAMCDFGGAELGLSHFREQYGRENVALQELIKRDPDPIKFYEELISFHDIEQPYRFQRYLLRLTSVMENQKTLNQAVKEHEKMQNIGIKKYSGIRPANWEVFLAAVAKEWNYKSSKMKHDTASLALREAEYLSARLTQTFAQTELLDLDISTMASKNYNLQSALNFPIKKPVETEAEVDKFHWPFEQEIWEDELDYLKTKNPSKCASVASIH